MPGIPGEVATIFSEETRRHIRSGGYILFTVLVPLLLIIAMFVVPLVMDAAAEDTPPETATEFDLSGIGFVDNSGILAGAPEQEGLSRYDTLEQGLEAYKQGDIETLYVIDSNYLETGEVSQYSEFKTLFVSNWEDEETFRWYVVYPQLKARQDSQLDPDLVAQRKLLDEQIAKQLNQMDPDLVARVAQPAVYTNFKVEEDGTVSEVAPVTQAVGELVVPAIFAMLLVFAVMTGVGNMVTSIAEEKENRLIELIIISTSPFQIMLGKLLALGTIGLAQSVLWVIVAAFTVPAMFDQIPDASELTITPDLMALILACYICGYFMSTTIAILIGAISSSAREASRIGPSFVMLGFVPLWFFGFLMQSPDGLFSRLLSYIPFTAPSGILVRIAAGGDMSGLEISASLAGMIATGLLFLWIASRVFRTTMLMQGQSITPSNLWAALKNAD
ncbi:MAG TPA: ABC transporter permease [Dehalococcoidia bacterium]|nr:ABC transporter permease [Dehalococcoidia bacterium]